eukprot:967863-Pelagomonas_calceolata.AAC.2
MRDIQAMLVGSLSLMSEGLTFLFTCTSQSRLDRPSIPRHELMLCPTCVTEPHICSFSVSTIAARQYVTNQSKARQHQPVQCNLRNCKLGDVCTCAAYGGYAGQAAAKPGQHNAPGVGAWQSEAWKFCPTSDDTVQTLREHSLETLQHGEIAGKGGSFAFVVEFWIHIESEGCVLQRTQAWPEAC